MKPKFVSIEDLPVFFARETGPYHDSAPAAFKKLKSYARQNSLDKSKLRCFAIGHDDPGITEGEKVRFDACLHYDEKLENTGTLGTQFLNGGEYAVFRYEGPVEEIEEAYDFIYHNWLPESGRELADQPIYQEHLNFDPYEDTAPEKHVIDFYVPLNK